MTATERESGNWGEQWSADEVGQLRSALGLSKASFAAQLEIHPRTARRWEQGHTAAIDHRVIAALDTVLCETVFELAPSLSAIQVRQMERRDVLRMLANGAFVPLGGVGLVQNGAPRRIGVSALNQLEAVSAGLARMYAAIPSEVLISPVAAHLEDATRLLRESVSSNQLPRLHTIIGDLSVFLGHLSFNGDRPAQARAYLSAAEDHASEANDPELLTRVLVATSWTYSNVTTGGQREPSQEALTRLQRADHLTKQVSPMLKTLVTAHLAE